MPFALLEVFFVPTHMVIQACLCLDSVLVDDKVESWSDDTGVVQDNMVLWHVETVDL